MNKERRDRLNKRKIAFVYLMHRMFEGNPAMMLKIIDGPKVTVEDLQAWNEDYKEAVYQTIQEEDSRGVKLKDPTEVPSIKSIKEKVLRRVDVLIAMNEDPARLAQVYKIMSEYEVADEKKEKSVIDAINDSISKTGGGKKELTIVDKMRRQNMITAPGKKRGRPRKDATPVAEEVTQPNEETTEE